MKSNALFNSVANIVSKLWAIASIYLFVPLYIHFLGEEAYGLVSFFSTMSAAISLLGLGLSSTLRREFALEASGGYEAKLKKYRLLRSVELLFGVIALLIAAACLSAAPWIAGKWLDSSVLGAQVVTATVRLMGLSIVLQLVSNLYFGSLMGLGQQVLANSLHVGYAALKAVGSVLVIMLIRPDVRLFYLWHVAVDALYILLIRTSLIRRIGDEGPLSWTRSDLSLIKTVWRYALGLAVISLIAFVNTQFDRITISKFLTLTELGAYSSCYTLGQIITIISSAVGTAVFPEFAAKSEEALAEAFRRYYRVVAVGACALGSFVALYSDALLLFWTKSGVYVSLTHRSSTLIVLGSMLLALQEVPYSLALSQGNTRINRRMGLSFLPVVVVGMYLAVSRHGLLGAAAVYFLMMSLQTVIYLMLVYRTFFKAGFLRWLLHDSLLPLSLSLVAALLSRTLCALLGLSGLGQIGFAVISGGVALLGMIFVFLRAEIKTILHR